MGTQKWMMFLWAVLTAVLWSVIATPAQAALLGHFPHMLAESMRRDPDAVACLQLTCDDLTSVSECVQEHARRVNDVMRGDIPSYLLSSSPYGEPDPSVTQLEQLSCGDVRPVATVIAERNLALRRRVLHRLVALRNNVKRCAHSGVLPDILPVRKANLGLQELAAERNGLYASLAKINEISAERCVVTQAQPVMIAKQTPVPPSARSAVRLSHAVKTFAAKKVASLKRSVPVKRHSVTKIAKRSVLAHHQRARDGKIVVRSRTANQIRLFIPHGASLGELRRAGYAAAYDVSASGVFLQNPYEKTIPYCEQSGKRNFDKGRWKFDRTRIGDAPRNVSGRAVPSGSPSKSDRSFCYDERAASRNRSWQQRQAHKPNRPQWPHPPRQSLRVSDQLALNRVRTSVRPSPRARASHLRDSPRDRNRIAKRRYPLGSSSPSCSRSSQISY